MRKQRWTVLALLLAALLAVTSPGFANAESTGPQAARTEVEDLPLPPEVRVLTWNICGAIARCPNDEKPKRKTDEIVSHAKRDNRIAVIMVQEACVMHANLLRESLPGEWVVHHRKAPNMNTGQLLGCAADKTSPKEQRFTGVAIALKKLPGSDLRPFDITFKKADSRPATQGAACIEDRGNALVACTSHFPNSSDDADPTGRYRAVAAQDFHDWSLSWQRRGLRTIIGGDLNLSPGDDEIKPLYTDHFEADTARKCNTSGPRQCTSWLGDKIDYIFFSDYGWDLKSGRVIYDGSWRYDLNYNPAPWPEGLSDHWMLTGTVKPSA
ncbi:endonuclease/exonuclease/phosphatase family protein [Streptomyces sp. NPDC000410]|uniref:endonuclease/exonuclease/phosphatase family protein n=1 Tax=Streptomyces sp. NPDC000410 TaxID=3154254 RepID=UPI0033314475